MLDDRDVELGDFLAELSRFVIRSQLVLPELLRVLAYDARLLEFTDKVWWRAPIEHNTDHA